MSFAFRLFILATVGLVSAACSSPAPAASGGAQQSTGGGQQNVLVVMTEFKFDPAAVTAQVNQPVRLTARNSGAVVHDWVVQLDSQVQAKAQPGQSATVEFTVTRPGTYRVVCTEAGHEQAGMVGSLVVR
ncbi:MAG: cupredoxin domain-containing protein [Chloroflexota bacterium]